MREREGERGRERGERERECERESERYIERNRMRERERKFLSHVQIYICRVYEAKSRVEVLSLKSRPSCCFIVRRIYIE